MNEGSAILLDFFLSLALAASIGAVIGVYAFGG